jgi:hypothetical protein
MGLLLAIIVLYFIISLFSKGFYFHLDLQICFLLFFLLTIYCLHEKHSVWITGASTIGSFIIFDILSHSLPLMIFAYSFYCLFLLFAIFVLAKKS